MTLLLLALFSVVGIGQWLSRVRALTIRIVVLRTVAISSRSRSSHILRTLLAHGNFAGSSFDQLGTPEETYWTHGIKFASARARRQGPGVPSNLEKSAKT